MKTISAAEANRHFSNLLRDASTGANITILSHGEPVAVLGPATVDHGHHKAARFRLLERLRSQQLSGERNWIRSDLYEKEE